MPRKVGKKIGGADDVLSETNIDGIAIINKDKFYIVSKKDDVKDIKDIINYEKISIDNSDNNHIISLPFYNVILTTAPSAPSAPSADSFIIKLNYLLYCLSIIKDVLNLLQGKGVKVDNLEILNKSINAAKDKAKEAATAATAEKAKEAAATAEKAKEAADAADAAADAAAANTAAAVTSEKKVAEKAKEAAEKAKDAAEKAATAANTATYDLSLNDVIKECVNMVKTVKDEYKSYDGLTDVFYVIRYIDNSSSSSYKNYLFIVDNFTIFDYSNSKFMEKNSKLFVQDIYNHFTNNDIYKKFLSIS